jgi:amidase
LTSTGDPIFSRAWTLLGGPAITLPLGAGANHLPLGVQLSANLHEDDKLVAHASWLYENIRDG